MKNKEFLVNTPSSELILCAAIHFNDKIEYPHSPTNIKYGYVVCGLRHCNCFNVAALIPKNDNFDHANQGFLTNLGRFVDRKEAGKIAFIAGQIPSLTTCLISEDLY